MRKMIRVKRVAIVLGIVLLSVLAHGLTAGPLAVRYGARSARDAPPPGEPAPAAPGVVQDK